MTLLGTFIHTSLSLAFREAGLFTHPKSQSVKFSQNGLYIVISCFCILFQAAVAAEKPKQEKARLKVTNQKPH